MKLLILLSFVVLLNGSNAEEINCLDSNGNPVDWFVALKLHEDADSQNKLIRDGVAHVYMDAKNPTFVLSDVSLNDSQQAIGYTLKQIYDNVKSEEVGYLMYNDELPNGKVSDYRGHTKGVLGFDSSGGFWLVHSTPKFPNFANETYLWPDNALRNGQSFLCISVDFKVLDQIGEQLMYNYPYVYDFKMPDKLAKTLTTLKSVIKGDHIQGPPYNRKDDLYTKSSMIFTSYSKFKDFNKDIYADWLAPDLKTNLFAETWQNGAHRLNSSCDGEFQVKNVKSLKILGSIFQKETSDHSKWAVSYSTGTKNGQFANKGWIENDKKIACIGGINRMKSQEKRAGGTVCCEIPEIWEELSKMILDVEDCPQKN